MIRRLIDYDRYNFRAALEALNRVYAFRVSMSNFFQPVTKLVAKTRHGAKVHKVYDTAQTPSQLEQREGLPYLGEHSLEELIKVEAHSTQFALTQAGRSSVSLTTPEINPFTIGQLLFLLEVQAVFTSGLYDINPMDQPGV